MKELDFSPGEVLTGDVLAEYIIDRIPEIYQTARQFTKVGKDHASNTIVTFEQLLTEITNLDFEPSLEIIIKLFSDYEKDLNPAGKVLCNYLLGFIRSENLSVKQIVLLLKQTLVYLKKKQADRV